MTTSLQILTLTNFTKKGNKITNSTSKIKKIIANKKKRNLKGSVPRSAELNPHSKGLNNSRSRVAFLVNKNITIVNTPAKIRLNMRIVKFIKINL